MSYIPAQFRVRVEFSKADCLLSISPPKDLVERSIKKLESEKAQGKLVFYRVYQERLDLVWQKLREAEGSAEQTVAVTLATGLPPFPGVLVQLNGQDAGKCTLTFTETPEVLRSWRLPLLKLEVNRQLSAAGITLIPDPSFIQAAWIKACHGIGKNEYPIRFLPQSGADLIVTGKRIGILEYPNLGMVTLLVHSFKDFDEHEGIKDILKVLQQQVAVEGQGANGYTVLTEDVVRALRSALRGPEHLDIDMPFMMLAAVKLGGMRPLVKSGNSNLREGILRDCLEINVSPDGMTAKIEEFNDDAYRNESLPLNVETIKADLQTAGITMGISEELMRVVGDHLKAKRSLRGLVLAAGRLPSAAEEPYLHMDFQDRHSSGEAGASQQDGISLRDRQPHKFVRRGEVVASVRFHKPAVQGFDVFGRKLEARKNDSFVPNLGEGLVLKNGKVFALFDGVPSSEGDQHVALSKSLIHEGHVNLTSGNIRFAGPVYIKGNVEQGSVIEAKGELVIEGLCQGGTLICAGNLIVKGGIIGDHHGRILVKGDLEAAFIENADIVCEGKILVTQSIISSQVKCSKSIAFKNPNSFILGGETISGGDIHVPNLGKDMGAITLVRCGADWRKFVKLGRLERRLKQVDAAIQIAQAELAKLRKPAPTHQKAQVEVQKEGFRARLTKAKAMVDRMKRMQLDIRRHMDWNEEACIIVQQKLSANCAIEIAASNVPLTTEYLAVRISAKASHGTHVHALQDQDQAS